MFCVSFIRSLYFLTYSNSKSYGSLFCKLCYNNLSVPIWNFCKVCFTMKSHQKQIKTVSGIFFLHIQLAKTLVHLSFFLDFLQKQYTRSYTLTFGSLHLSILYITVNCFKTLYPGCLSSSYGTDLSRCHLYHSYDICLTWHWALLIYKRICNMLTLSCSF